MNEPWAAGDRAVVYHNCRVRALCDQDQPANALAVQAGRVQWVGCEDDLGAGNWRRVDLGGAVVIPALGDAHTHLLWYALLRRRVDLRGATSEPDAASRVASYAADHPGSGWIQGSGWNENTWDVTRLPSRLSLDTVCPGRPVVLSRADGHMVWTNSVALQAAGITSTTPDPAGGQVDRDQGGEPTGILRDRAADPVRDRVPPPTLAERVAALREVQPELLSYGLVSLHTMEGRDTLEALQELRQGGDLRPRVLVLPPIALRPELEAIGLRPGFGDDHLRLGQLKLFVDGSLGSRTAWMLEDFCGEAGSRGLAMLEQAELVGLLDEAHLAGWPCAIHAIGDAANRHVLEALADVPRAPGPLPDRIEHVQCIRPEDAMRLSAQGVVASMQPVHVASDWRVSDRLWGERSRQSYAWQMLARAGAVLAFGSDAPVESINPWLGLQVAVTRQDLEGQPARGWYPEQRLSPREALSGFTSGVAAAAGEAGQGRLVAGARADFLVLEDDPLTMDPRALATISPLATYVDGVKVWTRND